MDLSSADLHGADLSSADLRSADLTAAELKVTHTALRSLLDDYGHEEQDIIALIRQVLDKLPDEHSIRAIDLKREARREVQGE